MTTELWGHQADFVEFGSGRNAVLADMWMGTGKSGGAIALSKRWGCRNILILAPLSVVESGWDKQFRLFGPEFQFISLFKGTVRKKTERAQASLRSAMQRGKPSVIVINFESAWREPFAKWAVTAGFDVLIVDEIHRLKSPGGKASRWVSRLATRIYKKIGLTGTPMPHSPLDVYAEFRILDPGVFGWSFVTFRRRYATMGGYGGKEVTGFQNIPELRSRMATITFQVGKEVLNRPEATHVDRVVHLSPDAQRAYKQMEKELVADFDCGQVTAANGLVRLLRLQQLTSGFAAIEPGEPPVRIDSSKLASLIDFFQDLPQDEPVVIFGQFHCDLDTVHEACKATGRKSLELSGRVRQHVDWQQGAGTILATQIASGGVGIDLTRARIACYLSTGFNGGNYEQSLARLDRPGQERFVSYYHFRAAGTVDIVTARCLHLRTTLVRSVLDNLSENPL